MLVGYLSYKYGIPIDRQHIIGHDEINDYKSDPGPAWDWDRFIELAKKYRNPSTNELISDYLNAS